MNSDKYALLWSWVSANLVKVSLPVYSSSNYILADDAAETLRMPVEPAEMHRIMVEMGYTAVRRHRVCYAYNAKYRIEPIDEEMEPELADWPVRHKPVIMFAQIGSNGPIFIMNTTNLRGRLEELQKYNPYVVGVLGVMRGSYKDLENLVASWEPHILREGWYEPAPEVLAFIYQSGQVQIF